MSALLLVLQLQAASATVGDTVRIERVVGDIAGAVIRPQPWSLGARGDQLGPAEVIQGARGAVVRYALVLWYPGEHTLSMPGPVLVRRDGSSDTLAASTHRVRVESVLTPGVRRDRLEPKPARDPLAISSRTLLPLALLGGVVLLLFVGAALLWRRRGKAVIRPERVEVFPQAELLRRWAAAGEYRSALDGWSWRLARRLAKSSDLAECATLQRMLDEIADQVYVPVSDGVLARLCERASALEPS